MEEVVAQDTVLGKDHIARLAYELWEKAGQPPGRDLDFWLQAETQLRTRKKSASAKPHSMGASSNSASAQLPTIAIPKNGLAEIRRVQTSPSKNARSIAQF